MLFAAECRAFAGGSTGNQGGGAFGDLPFDEVGECVFRDTAPGKWRYQRRNRAEKHELTSGTASFLWTDWPRSLADKEGDCKMSSMWRLAVTLPVLLAIAPSSSAQYAEPGTYSAQPAYVPSVASSIEQWRTLRQSSGYRFSDYASFLIANPDWPDGARMRGWAEKAMQPGEYAATVLAFFASDKPKTGNGWA